MGAALDDIGEAYDASFTDREAQRERGRRLVAALPSGARVLDLGCGSGVPTARQLVDAGLDVVGIDESARMLGLAAATVPEAVLHHRDLRELGPERTGQEHSGHDGDRARLAGRQRGGSR